LEKVGYSLLELSMLLFGQTEGSHKMSLETEESLLLQEMTVLSVEGISLVYICFLGKQISQIMKNDWM
jgi:hypothetical protein